jgi:hypothetical protein
MIDVRARSSSGARNGLRFLLRGMSTLLALLFITSCGNSIFIAGTPVVTLTTERGHFTSYIVNIDQIYVTRQDGTIGYLSTVNLRADLAQISNFVNLMDAPAVQEGTYVSATIILDYSAPYITVDASGQAGSTTLIDVQTGTSPTTQTLTINFDPNHPLVIGNQTSSLVNFNIDLEASNTIDFSKGLPATVTIHPVVSVTATPVYQKPVFSRGIFVFADTANNNFVMNTRQLHDVVTNQTFGALKIVPSAQAYWNINGVAFSGSAGLAALAKLQSQTASLQVGVVGTGPGTGTPFSDLSGVTPVFNATEVYVGTSLESTIQDHIMGIVSGISGNTLTVLGAELVDRLGNPGFAQAIPVTVGSSTIISEDGNASFTPALNAISVGQFINVSGVVTYLTDGSTNPASLDATAGQVRLQPTTLWGTLISQTPGTANVILDWVENYEPTSSNISFKGTGSSVDASITNYVINTGSLSVSPSPSGALFPSLYQFVGTANTFGQGPPYFNATSVTPASSLPQQLILEWVGGGSSNPFTSVGANGLYVNLQDPDLTGTGAVHVLKNDPGGATQQVDVLSLPNPNNAKLSIVPSTASPATANLFTVGNIVNGLYVFNDPTNFANRVLSNIGAAALTHKLVATGQYDPTTGAFTATNIEIYMH